MRVLLDGMQAGNRSGIGSYTSALIRELPSADPEIELHVLCPRSTLSDLPETDALNLIPCTDGRSPLATLQRSIAMAKHLRQRKPDILHYPASFMRLMGGAPSKDTKMLLTVHDLSFLREPEWFRSNRSMYYRSMIRRSASRATRILVDSKATALDLQELLEVDSSKIDVAPLGVDARFRPASEADITRAQEIYDLPEAFFLYVGTLEPRKNLPRLIEAYDRIAATCDHDLVIAGREGWKFAGIYEAATNARHSTRIHFIGFVDDSLLPALLSAASVFVWPSLWEGFGLPPLEAMACGTPVVTSNTSSLPEVVGDAALRVQPEDVEAISEAMRSLAGDAELRASFERLGLERASKFTWERTAELTCAAYCRAREVE